MQDCFRQYPEMYGAELQDDEEGESSGPLAGAEGGEAGDLPEPTKAAQKLETPEPEATDSQKPGLSTESWKAEVEEKREDSKVIPKKAVDATDANAGKQL